MILWYLLYLSMFLVPMGKYEAHRVSKIKLNLQQFLGSLYRPQVSVPTNREVQTADRKKEMSESL